MQSVRERVTDGIAIDASKLSLRLGGVDVLRGVDFSLRMGEVASVVGPSGSGKTTLLRALALLRLPDRGMLSLLGKKYRFPRTSSLSAEEKPWPDVTCVFQDLYLWPHLTLRQNIALPLAHARADRGSSNEDLEALIKRLGLSDCVERMPHEASGGERQRAAIARAVALRPRVLLLDEVTSALDIEQVASILALLTSLRDSAMTMVVVTHHIEFAKRISDRVFFMDRGEIVESGRVDILENASTARLAKFLEFVKAAR